MKEQMVRDLLHRVVGMRMDDAKRLVESNGLMVRVTTIDGIQLDGSAQYIPYRINLDVIDDVVRESRVG